MAWLQRSASRCRSRTGNLHAARDPLVYILHYAFVDAALNGTFDSDLDGTPDEQHPDWAGTIDWLGLQYYFRSGVWGAAPPLGGVKPCIYGIDLGACLPADEPSYCAPDRKSVV